MIVRTLARSLHRLARQYPVITITGPRQSGKTTLCRAAFPRKDYVSLEPVDVRDYARQDPRGLLAEHPKGAIFDEVQHAPDLLSYLQTEVDERPSPGRFILTGSQHFGLTASVAQTLAGRTAMLYLMPPSLDELKRFGRPPMHLWDTVFTGAYPRIHDQGLEPERWLSDYVTTYLQRDVRQVTNVGDLSLFTTFLRLCAGRTAQESNLSALGGDVGVSHATARAWLTVLEASFLCFRIPAFHRSLTKQLVKAPKLHFLDSGLACYLLGIKTPDQLRHHPSRGALFESWVASEVYKAHVHHGVEPRLYHFRESRGLEVDLVVERGDTLVLTEVKSGATVATEFLAPLAKLAGLLTEGGEHRSMESRLVYGGELAQRRSQTTIIPWDQVPKQRWID